MLINPERQAIPAEFIEKLPEGFKVTNRKGAVYVVVHDLRCPNGHSLMTDAIRFHGEPAIHMRVKGGGVKGTMFLDPFWGLHQKLFDFMFKANHPNPTITASCPECNASLMVSRKCDSPDCKSEEFIEFNLPRKNDKIDVCGRWGCPEHNISIGMFDDAVRDAVSRINYGQDIHTHGEVMGF